MKRNYKLFFRSFYMSLVIIFCMVIGCVGISKAYENTVQTGFGIDKKAIEYSDGKLRILDFVIEINA